MYSGNLTKDVRLNTVKTKDGDVSVANFTIAINDYRSRKGSDGEKNTQKYTTFIDCEAWDSGAENIAKMFKKGDFISLQTELRQDTWEDDEGNKRSKHKLRVNKFEKPYVSKSTNTSGDSEGEAEAKVNSNPDDDDIPF